jgi:hypothetical protein
MMCECPFDGAKELIGRYRLGQNIVGARLDRLYGGRDIGIAREKHDGQGRTEFAEPSLQVRGRSSPVS